MHFCWLVGWLVCMVNNFFFITDYNIVASRLHIPICRSIYELPVIFEVKTNKNTILSVGDSNEKLSDLQTRLQTFFLYQSQEFTFPTNEADLTWRITPCPT